MQTNELVANAAADYKAERDELETRLIAANERAKAHDMLLKRIEIREQLCNELGAERDALAERVRQLEKALDECFTHDGALAERNHTMACKRLAGINETVSAAIAKAKGAA